MNGRKTNNLRSCRRPYLQQGNRDLHGRSLRDGRRRLHRACGWGGGSRQGYDPDRQRDRPVPRTTLSFVQRKRQPDAEDNDSGDESARDRTDGKSPCLGIRPDISREIGKTQDMMEWRLSRIYSGTKAGRRLSLTETIEDPQMRRILVAVVAVLTCSGGFARGADILAVNYDCFLVDHCRDNNPASILIRGTITEGDSAKFRNIIVQSGFPVVTVILRSNGGNVQEAMKIGRDIRKLLLETEGPQLDYYPDRDGSLSYGSGDHPLCIENGMGEFKGSRYKASECVCASA